MAPINAFHSSHFRSVETYLNSTLISQTDNLYGYKAYIQKLLTYRPDAKTTFLECGQFYEDYGALGTFAESDGVMDTSNNEGLTKRFELAKGSKLFQSFGRIHSDLFLQPKFLLGSNELRISLIERIQVFR